VSVGIWPERNPVKYEHGGAFSLKMRYRKQGEMLPLNWHELQSPEARSLQGHGWPQFSRNVRQERGNRCQLCNSTRNLQVHHILRVRFFRHLRFERWNVIALCQPCHKDAEAGIPDAYVLYRTVEYQLEGA
jgi:5-methylcytosine-specific restriction endonuclease McrA